MTTNTRNKENINMLKNVDKLTQFLHSLKYETSCLISILTALTFLGCLFRHIPLILKTWTLEI